MEKEQIDFNKLAEKIPENWCPAAELQGVSDTILENLKNTMNADLDEAAKMVDCSTEEILETLQKAANVYGRMILFEEKYSDIVAVFPKGEDGVVNYPDKILARIYGVSIEAAVEIFENHFGVGTNEKLSELIIKQH